MASAEIRIIKKRNGMYRGDVYINSIYVASTITCYYPDENMVQYIKTRAMAVANDIIDAILDAKNNVNNQT